MNKCEGQEKGRHHQRPIASFDVAFFFLSMPSFAQGIQIDERGERGAIPTPMKLLNTRCPFFLFLRFSFLFQVL